MTAHRELGLQALPLDALLLVGVARTLSGLQKDLSPSDLRR